MRSKPSVSSPDLFRSRLDQIINMNRPLAILANQIDWSVFEKELWGSFWSYALDPEQRQRAGIKNAQIEAPGSMFVPGTIYTLHIEHDGGIRIDAQPIPEILKGETLT